MAITGTQIRLARVALRLSVEELSVRTRVSTSTIKRIEAVDGIPSSTEANLKAIQSALEATGIEFIGSPEDGPGLRIWSNDQTSNTDAFRSSD